MNQKETDLGIPNDSFSRGNALVNLAVVRSHGYESDNVFVVGKDGQVSVFGETILASDDGHRLASGHANSEVSGPLEILDWNSANHTTKFEFKANCAPKKWLNAKRLIIYCQRDDDDSLMTIGQVTQLPNGQWRLDETDALNDDPKTHIDSKQHILLHLIARKSQRQLPDAQITKYWTELGFR